MTNQVPKKSNWPVLLALVVAAFLLGSTLWQRLSGSKPDPNAEPVFDPSQAAELEIKGTRPDGTLSWSGIAVPAGPPLDDALRARGRELFSKACAGCHGDDGKGDGAVAKRLKLSTRPADLSRPLDSIKIHSTLFEMPPLPEDLFRTITRGLPGTAMWSYAGISEADRWALVQHIRSFSPDYSKGEPAVVTIPAKIPADADMKTAGATLYTAVCLNCHGMDAMGAVVPMVDRETGRPYLGLAFARKGGTEMLGGGSDEDIARTILAGFHRRSLMQSFRTSYIYGIQNPTPEQTAAMDRKLWGLVHYVRGLLDAQKNK